MQGKSFSWTNANPAVARNLDCGFEVAEATTVDVTNGGSWYWNTGMADGYYLDVDAGTITTSNGFTPYNLGAVFAADISAFTNANPGVITASNVTALGFAAGDSISVSGLADDQTATSLNGTFTVASVTATAITLVENTSAYSVYVSGGFAKRVSDTNGDPVAQDNVGSRGVTCGTGCVGAASAVMAAFCKSQEPVV